MRTQLIALLGAAALIAPATAQAQNPLSSLFSCNTPNNRQGTGAVAGALIGGLLGNQINDNDRTTGTVVGGLLGAAAGSAIGCKMSRADTTRAEDATRRALAENRSQTWSNADNGTSGRIDIVDSYNQNDRSGRYGDRDRYRGPASLNEINFARGVRQPVDYVMADGRYQARARVNVRAAPSTRGAILTRLQSGEQFDVLARTRDGWLLVSRGNRAVGYVSEGVVSRVDGGYGRDRYDNDNRYADNDRYRPTGGNVCRVFDQTVAYRNEAPTTQRYTACQTSNGEWILQS